MADLEELSHALDAIERYEAQFLSWGIVDQSMSSDKLDELIESAGVSDLPAVRDRLLSQNLVTRVRFHSPARFRSRMAEGVRLFAQLKQLFPGQRWEGAANLVADFRFLVRPRRFARRDRDVEELLERLSEIDAPSMAPESVRRLVGTDSNGGSRLLSGFQIDATAAIVEGLQSRTDQACVVSAGTGQGKTLAFYLPTLLYLSQQNRSTPATSVVAIYPRNELLKDQLLATLREVRRLQDVGQPSTIRIGTYFGPTPNIAKSHLDKHHGWSWSKALSGYACPFLVCPGPSGGDPCGGRLVWRDEDRLPSKPIERLTCEACGEIIGDDLVALTRQSLNQRPPDILFTTTESLNRRLPDNWNRHIFGVGPRAARPPRIVLLDEAHTYTGSAGAQTAYLLRRWRSQIKGPVMWVGLSATLRDARQFFSTLTGVELENVREIQPDLTQSIEKGHEYQLLLRGDPVSQTALLSTSIQSLMLLLRLLDPLGHDGSGMLGHKVFAFCDNLNVINRLYRQLLDAEGRDPWGRIASQRHGGRGSRDGSLALLRSEEHNLIADDWATRDRQGQAWWMIDQIRESATPPVIGRTSSQDAGVAKDAEVVVATASLEVGYDDPDVGAVLQHKAPRDVAQFVQRRGRAGRSQEMRPWTVVVLSDYGRDRLTYQTYEQLFDPLLPPKSLPVSNRSVQRMQATFAVMDWLASRAERNGLPLGYVRNEVSAPLSMLRLNDSQRANVAQRITWMKDQLTGVLDVGPERTDLQSYLGTALGLSSEDVDLLLWQGPRAVLTEAIPTMLRRIESDWDRAVDSGSNSGSEAARMGEPLPEFLPGQLFSDLALPEIAIVSPPDYDSAADASEPAFLALNELAPGKVTLRYAVQETKGLWIDPRDSNDSGGLDVSASLLDGGEVLTVLDDEGGGSIPVVRPYRISPAVVENEISESSDGRLRWEVLISRELSSLEVPTPEGSQWHQVIPTALFFVQAGGGGLRVLRYASGGRAEIVERRVRRIVDYSFHDGETPVAVGVELDVDGVAFPIKPPDHLDAFRLGSDPSRRRQLVTDWFHEQVAAGFAENDAVNPFLARRMSELALAAVAHAVVEGMLSSSREATAWDDARWKAEVLSAFERSMKGLRAEDEVSDSPLSSKIELVFVPHNVATVLRNALESALAGPTDAWLPYLQQRFTATVAAAVCGAAQSLLPEFDVDAELNVDLINSDDGTTTIWMTETTVGGGGITESFYAAYAEDPRRFWHIAASQLEPGAAEQTAESLSAALMQIESGSLAELARTYRQGAEGDGSLQAWSHLMAGIGRAGVVTTHALSVALATRVFRAGSSELSDAILRTGMQRWREFEESTGFALEHRTACSLLAEDSVLAAIVASAAPGDSSDQTPDWRFNLLLSMLWLQPESLRATSLQFSNAFVDNTPLSERTLVLDQFDDERNVIDVTQPWRAAADPILARTGRCTLSVPVDQESVLRDALLGLVTEEVDVGALLLHPKVTGIRRRADRVEALIELHEAPQ